MIRDVLVHVDASPAGSGRLDYAIALADRHSARLIGTHVLAPVDVPPYFRPRSVEREAQHLEHEARRAAAAAEALFAQRTVGRRLPTDWRGLSGDMKRLLCAEAACADLVILGQYESEGTPERHPLILAEEVVLDCGRPVLVIPEAAPVRQSSQRALIAWDGSREAVRAVHDAIPLLSAADTVVEILVADEHGVPAPPTDLVAHLGRHGVTVDPAYQIHTAKAAGEALIRRLSAGEFDLLVMGAYSHPAWLEFLFGGTTHSALMQSSAPVLISH